MSGKTTRTKAKKPTPRKAAKRTARSRKRAGKRPAKRVAAVKPKLASVSAKPERLVYASRLQRAWLSLALLFLASLTSSSVVTAASADMQKAEIEAQSALVTHMQPKEYLYLQASSHGLDYELLHQIAYCESHWRMVKNAGSSAYGFFQIIDRTERYTPQFKAGGRKYDPFTNIDMAVYLNDKYGTFPWLESRPCWQARLKPSE